MEDMDDVWFDAAEVVWDALSEEQFVANLAPSNFPVQPVDEVRSLLDEGCSEELTLLNNMDFIDLQSCGFDTTNVMHEDFSFSELLGNDVDVSTTQTFLNVFNLFFLAKKFFYLLKTVRDEKQFFLV
jgi:hypothetical protein